MTTFKLRIALRLLLVAAMGVTALARVAFSEPSAAGDTRAAALAESPPPSFIDGGATDWTGGTLWVTR